jgi:hypothetical protein
VILTWVRWNLTTVLICISHRARNDEHFFMSFWSFGLLPLKKLYLVYLPISSLGHWFLGSVVFWAPCIVWLLIFCQMCSWQRFSPISVDYLFNLVTISFVVQKKLFSFM